MDDLKQELYNLIININKLENQIEQAKIEAENNIKPLNIELTQVKEDKRKFASKNDFDSVQICIRRENNLKFKINAQWNKYSLLKNDLLKLNNQRNDLENQIKLKEDQIKRKNEILNQMNNVLDNYKKTQNLNKAAINSKINPDHVKQWLEWGKNSFNDTYTYFYNEKIGIDKYFKKLESEQLKNQMDLVIEAYENTNSLKKASSIANVSYDTVKYWYDWGLRGFGEENTYFFKKIKELDEN